MRTDSKKLKLLYLMRVFRENTDATHGLSIPELSKKMEAYGLSEYLEIKQKYFDAYLESLSEEN